MEKPICFHKSKQKGHKGEFLQEILRVESNTGDGTVVRWCSNCGAITVDDECDGRFMSSDMSFPQILTDMANNGQ